MTAPRTPSWLQPSTVGQLSNKRASNTTSDRVTAQFHFASDAGGAFPGSLRVVGTRPVVAGQQQQNPNNIWDTAWVGNYATSPFPLTISMGCQAAVTVGNRVYVVAPTTFPYGAGNTATGAQGIVATIYSAPINGMNIGSWRLENPVQPLTLDAQGVRQPTYDSCNPGAIAQMLGNLFVLGQKAIYKCQVNPDGSLGTWTVFAATGSGAGSTMCAWGGATGGGIAVVYAHATNSPVNVALMDANGNWLSWVPGGFNMGVARQYGACFIDPNGWFYHLGGEDGAGNAVAATHYRTIDLVTGVLGAVNAGLALPAARSRFGFMYVFSPSAFWAGGSPPGSIIESSFAVAGGQAGNAGTGAAVNTVYDTIGGTLRGGGVWSSYTAVLHNPQKGCCAAATGATGNVAPPSPGAPIPGSSFALTSGLSYDPTVDPTNPDQALICIGGSSTTDVQTARINDVGFHWGATSVLTTFILGTGSAVTANADGSYDITFPISGAAVGGFGVAMGVTTLSDGDQLQLTVQVADAQSGDVATSLPTLIRIGQPPTLSSIAPSGTISNGQPTGSFLFVPGAGGQNQYTYQIIVKQGATVIYDTGVRYDGLNSALLTIAPLLLPSTTYTLVITATSLDVPMTGSTNQVSSTTTFTTSGFAVLAAPGGLSIIPNNPLGRFDISWGAVGSASGYNLYYRRTLVGGSWYLYQGNIQGTSLSAYDHLALNTAYDFAISTLSATPAESALSSAVLNNTILPPTLSPGSYSAYLHIAGLGTTYSVPVSFQTVDTSNPGYKEEIAAAKILGFQQAAPIYRYGAADYRTLALKAFLNDLTAATLKSLQGVMDQVKLGQVAFWRDAMGGMLVVAFDASQQLVLHPPSYREGWLQMTEVLDTVGPYVVSGSAQGYLTLVSGRKPPLDTSERVL